MEAPKLAPPGAGIPLHHKLLARYVLLPKFFRKHGWEQAQELFDREEERILAVAGGMDPRNLTRPVLVPPMRGLEDSSRFWSVSMAIEHLIIVGDLMGETIVRLSRGERMPTIADTAAVKPKENRAPAAILRDFIEFAQRFRRRMAEEVADRGSPQTHPHPWFGPLTARQWHGLAAIHQNLHRKQIEAIAHGLFGSE